MQDNDKQHPTSATRRQALQAGAAMLAGLAAPASFAQAARTFPHKRVTVLVPYSAGGYTDTLGRQLAARLTEHWKQPAIVENRAGGNTVIAVRALLSAPADGHALLLNDLAAQAINPSLFKELSYDPAMLVPAAGLSKFSFILLVHPDAPVRDLKSFATWARQRKGLSCATAGIGNPTHLAMELMRKAIGAELVNSPYKGGPPALNDLMAGQVDSSVMDISGSMQLVKAGKLKPLAVFSAERHPLLEHVPTVAEQGWPGFEFNGWNTLSVHRDTPAAIVQDINNTVRHLIAQPDFTAWLRSNMVIPDGDLTTAQLATRVQADAARLGKLVRELGISAD